MENREYVLDRIKGKAISIDEFNYDKLQAPPISSMFTPMDIAQLNQIAKSLKYSAKPKIKYEEIDKIMRKRGFVKFISGTNRIAYRPIEDNSFIVKVAYDAIGLGDNPREFKNQFLFKPFITKVFEVTPCGTLGVFERVVPITSREEFISIASDIYTVINEWFIGEYVLEDFGTNYFLNWGVRKFFGPVLLDFPYVYRLDGNKLFCNAPNPGNPSGCCEGVIDYDPGFNYLYCTKCGVKYRAKELETAVKEKQIIIRNNGGRKMKVKVKGGTKNLNEVISVGADINDVASTPSKPINATAKIVESEIPARKVLVALPKKENDKVEPVMPKPEVEEIVKAPVNIVVSGGDPKREQKEVISPIEFDADIKSTSKFLKLLSEARELFDKADKEDKEEMIESLSITFEDIISETIDKATAKINETNEQNSEINFAELFESGEYGIRYFPTDSDNIEFYEYELEGVGKFISHDIIPAIVRYTDTDKEEEVVYTGVEIGVGLSDSDIMRAYEMIKNNDSSYDGIDFYASQIINVKDIFQDQSSSKILAIVDKDGKYVTVDGKIIGVDVIDDQSVDAISVVSKSWLDSIVKEHDKEMHNITTGVAPEYEEENEE